MSTKRSAPSAPLRRIAVHVDEPEPGWFAWALTEADEALSTWSQIDHADEWLGTYREAMAAGLLALQLMIPDLDAGPRDEPPATARKSKATGHFGFGFGTNLR